MYKVIYLGTPAMSAELLEKIILWNQVEIIGAVTQPDNPYGKKDNKESPVSKICSKYNIPCHKPIKLNKDYGFIEELKPDLILTFAYGQIVSEKVLNLSKYKALNIHGSILPKYRGAAPIQYALLNGEKESGATLMAMEKTMDSGDIYGIEKFDIDINDNYSSLCKKMVEAGFKVFKDNILKFFANEITPIKQDESLVTFAPSIKSEAEHINLSLNCNEIINYIRALSYTPGAYLYLNGEKVKIYKAHLLNNKVDDEVGKVILAKKESIVLQLKDGQILIDELQRPGKKILSAKDFNNGSNINGQKFE